MHDILVEACDSSRICARDITCALSTVSSSSIRVLLCDDSDHVRRYMRRTLDADERVEIVGEAALVADSIAKAAELKPDLVVLDIQMPDGSGYDALRAIKDDAPETVVVMLTNYADPIFRQACVRAGANYFFDKTTEFHRVRDLINALLDERAGADAPESASIAP